MPRFVVAVLSCLPLIAQQAVLGPRHDGPVGVAISRGCGLQPTADGLLGGGAHYRARFSAEGVRFEPALGSAVEVTQHLSLTLGAVRRGAEVVIAGESSQTPIRHGDAVVYRRGPHVRERFEVAPEHVALSWVFDEPLSGSGDLTVRYQLATSLPAPVGTEDGGLAFLRDGTHGVTIGGVTGIDARGERCRGVLRHVQNGIELTLPAAFVDAAVHPLVLDPLIGTTFDVQNSPMADATPDAAYDSATDRFLVTWRRTFSSSDVDIMGQLVSGSGNLVGPTLFLPSAGVAGPVRVANLPARGRFGVTWSQRVGNLRTVKFIGFDPTTFLVTHVFDLASSTVGSLYDADIGSDLSAPIGSNRGFVVVYEDDVLDAIRARRIYFDANDQLVSPAAFSVFIDSSGPIASTYGQPEVSRAALNDGWLMVVARRYSGLGPFRSIHCRLVDTGSSTLGPATSLGGTATDVIDQPDVDGFAGRWTVAWRTQTAAGVDMAIKRRPVQLTPGGTFALGTEHTTGAFGGLETSFPNLAHTAGRTWLGYFVNYVSLFFPNELHVVGVDTGTGTTCEGLVVFSETLAQPRTIVISTQSSGGATSGETALAVFADQGDLYGQLLRNHGTAGTSTPLGGGCGNGGTQSLSHAPGIGSSGLVCSVAGLAPTALVSVFNFSEPASLPVQCLPCVINPFSVTLVAPIVGSGASVEFPIPCLSSLVGMQFETQWTTVDFSQAPCPQLAGLSFSERLRLVIGN